MYDPVLDALAVYVEEGAIEEADLRMLAQAGWAYKGRELPLGIEQQEPGRCFDASRELAADGLYVYVRGFALRPWSRQPLPHAWVTLARRDAIDVSWDRQAECRYFGVKGDRHEGLLDRMSASLHRHYGWDRPQRQAWTGVAV